MILVENYTGRGNKNIQKAFNELKIALPRAIDMYKGSRKGNVRFTEDRNILKMCEYLSKEFKTTIHVYIAPTSPLSDATHTVPGTFRFFRGNTADGKLDVRGTHSYIFLDTVTIVEHKLTPEEVFAILLHEIGHNIDNNVITLTHNVMNAVTSYGIASLIGEMVHHSYGLLNPLIDKVPGPVKRIYHDISSYLRMITPLMSPLGLVSIMYLPYAILPSFLGYYGERFSDSVATHYGYGVPLSTALFKLDGTEVKDRKLKSINPIKRLINTNPVTGLMFDLCDAMNMMMLTCMMPHPNNINRAKNALTRLKAERSQGKLPKPLLKEIDRDIDSLEKIISDFERIHPSEYNVFTSATNKLLAYGDGRNRNVFDMIYKSDDYEY